MCIVSIYITCKSDKCFPHLENEELIKSIKNIVNNKLIILNEINNIIIIKDEWINLNKYEGNATQFLLIENGQITNGLFNSTNNLLLSIPNLIDARLVKFGNGYNFSKNEEFNPQSIKCYIPLYVPSPSPSFGIKIEHKYILFSVVESTSGYMIYNDTCPHKIWNNTGQDDIGLLIDFKI